MAKTTLAQLRLQKAKLLKIAKKIRQKEKQEAEIRREKVELKRDIAKLRAETSKNVIIRTQRNLRKFARDPENKRRAELIKKETAKGLKKFRKFADKYG